MKKTNILLVLAIAAVILFAVTQSIAPDRKVTVYTGVPCAKCYMEFPSVRIPASSGQYIYAVDGKAVFYFNNLIDAGKIMAGDSYVGRCYCSGYGTQSTEFTGRVEAYPDTKAIVINGCTDVVTNCANPPTTAYTTTTTKATTTTTHTHVTTTTYPGQTTTTLPDDNSNSDQTFVIVGLFAGLVGLAYISKNWRI